MGQAYKLPDDRQLEAMRSEIINAIHRLSLLPESHFTQNDQSQNGNSSIALEVWRNVYIEQAANEIVGPITKSALVERASKAWVNPATAAVTKKELEFVARYAGLLQETLKNLHKPAYYKLLSRHVDPLENDGLPVVLSSLAAAASASVAAMDMAQTQRGAPPKALAAAIRERAATQYMVLTGKVVGRTASTSGGPDTGPFVKFLEEIFAIFGIKASPGHQARQAAAVEKKDR